MRWRHSLQNPTFSVEQVMTRRVNRSIVFFLAILAGIANVFAQPASSTNVSPTSIFDGETIKYEGKLNRFKLSFSVAELTFTTSRVANSNDLFVKAEAVSKGTLLSIFRFSFLQQVNSTIATNEFRILKTVKRDVQKERVRESEAIFDYKDKRVTYIETDPKDKMRAPRRIASEIPDLTQDMVSGIYYLRLQQLAVGKRFEVQVSDSGLVYKVPIVVTAREQQKTPLGKSWCWRIEPEVFGMGRLIEQKGKMVIWITDDDRRIPVRSQVNSEYGKIDIKLKSYSKGAMGAQ